MKKTVKKLAAIALAAAFTCGALGALTACEPGKGPGTTKPRPLPTPGENEAYKNDYDPVEEAYEYASGVLYGNNLDEFYKFYTAAAHSDSLAAKYAYYAQAEAKLLQAGVMLPTSANGGNYAMSKAVPGTATSVKWGSDSDRMHTLIVTTTPLTVADRSAIRDHWNDNPNETGAAYLVWVKDYLANHGYTVKREYNAAYTSDPTTFDIFNTSEQPDSEVIVQTYDNLLEYDSHNVARPALATNVPEGVENADGTVSYTFNVRSGVKWVDSQGREFADLKPSDFVAGFQHLMDCESGLEEIVSGIIVGAADYCEGVTTTMNGVGVKADDSAMTVTYTITEEMPAFTTMFGYSLFAPLCKSYYESKGGKFGTEFDASASSYTYGKTYNDIVYCGPYRITAHSIENSITFTKNDSWWNTDPAARNLDTINYKFNDGEDPTKTYTDFKAGTLDGCGLTTTTIPTAKQEIVTGDPNVAENTTYFDAYHYTSGMDATAFCMFTNLNRGAFANYNDANKVVSSQSEAEAARTAAAMQNVHFRRAFTSAVDRKAYMAAVYGDELAEKKISNTYVPGNFVSLPEAVTLTIGDVEKTYPVGTYYGEIVQDQLNADNYPLTVWKEVDGEMSSYGFDGWYNVEFAKKELATAITELQAKGVTVDAAHPIQIDYVVFNSAPYPARANALKQNVERDLEGKVQVNLVMAQGIYDWYYACFFPTTGAEMNYDINDLSGWGPDYGDPKSYLDCFLPDYTGYMTKCLGIF